MNIQLATQEDLHDIKQLYDAINDYLDEGINYAGWERDIYPTQETAIAGINSNTLYVAWLQGVIIGTIIINHTPEPAYKDAPWTSSLSDSEVLIVHTFAVHPDYLKRGVGRKLLEFTIQHGKSIGAKAIRLDTYEKNTPAISLYEKLSFKYISTVDLGLHDSGLDWFKLFELKL